MVDEFVKENDLYIVTDTVLCFCFSVITFEICVANRYKLNKKFRKLQEKTFEDPNNLALRSQLHTAQVW